MLPITRLKLWSVHLHTSNYPNSHQLSDGRGSGFWEINVDQFGSRTSDTERPGRINSLSSNATTINMGHAHSNAVGELVKARHLTSASHRPFASKLITLPDEIFKNYIHLVKRIII